MGTVRFRGNLGKGKRALLLHRFRFSEQRGAEGIGILGAIVKQTNQKKKGEWMNG
jgi:hypothetical protein